MLQINVHDAKTRFSKVLSRVEAGESVVIAKNGRPVAKLVPLGRGRRFKRRLGAAKGLVRMSPDWDAPLAPGVLRAFDVGS